MWPMMKKAAGQKPAEVGGADVFGDPGGAEQGADLQLGRQQGRTRKISQVSAGAAMMALRIPSLASCSCTECSSRSA
jgi:hypothetical protein